MNPVDLRLNVIVGGLPADDVVAIAQAAVRGGATLVQYREKSADTRAMVACARRLVEALRPHGVPVLVNDRVDVALASGAAGVHLGRDDMDPDDARALLGPDAIIGATVKSQADAVAAIAAPVDYACIGGVFATLSKHNPDPPVGLAGLGALRRQIRAARPDMPVGAIAGIGLAEIASVVRAGADGVAVISAVCAAPDPAAAAAALRAAIETALREHRA